MMHRQSHQILITAPKGIVIVAQRLYEHLEAWMQPDDLGLLGDMEFWTQLSELVARIHIERTRHRKLKGPPEETMARGKSVAARVVCVSAARV